MGYTRRKTDLLIDQAGYDINSQIKVLEKLYAGEDISIVCPSAAEES
jgi:hypothetical protein